MIRFILGLIPATLLLLVSPLFPKHKSGEFSISGGMLRRWAFQIVGLGKFE
jgi:hypothetical protein